MEVNLDCWTISQAQQDQMLSLWILDSYGTPADKKAMFRFAFFAAALFVNLGAFFRGPRTQQMQMMRYDRRRLHASEMVPT